MGYVVPRTLASSSDYAEWTQATAPANIAAILRGCTTLVLKATRLACYATDEATGLATDVTVREALRDATCIQASAWVALGIDPSAGGTVTSSKSVKRKKIGSAEIEYTDSETRSVAAARATAAAALVPEAEEYLRNRGLAGRAAVSHS